jgi:acetate kinase
VVLYLMLSAGMTPLEMDMLLNKQSGLLGLSGVSHDREKVIEKSNQGHWEAHEAIEVFCHRLKKYISSYVGVLNGADGLVFSGGIG